MKMQNKAYKNALNKTIDVADTYGGTNLRKF